MHPSSVSLLTEGWTPLADASDEIWHVAMKLSMILLLKLCLKIKHKYHTNTTFSDWFENVATCLLVDMVFIYFVLIWVTCNIYCRKNKSKIKMCLCSKHDRIVVWKMSDIKDVIQIINYCTRPQIIIVMLHYFLYLWNDNALKYTCPCNNHFVPWTILNTYKLLKTNSALCDIMNCLLEAHIIDGKSKNRTVMLEDSHKLLLESFIVVKWGLCLNKRYYEFLRKLLMELQETWPYSTVLTISITSQCLVTLFDL